MFLRRLIGCLLIIAALTGFILSMVGLVDLWRIQPGVTQAVRDTLALIDQTLNTTQDGLSMVGQVVKTTTDDVASLQTTTLALAQTIHDTNPMLDSLTGLTSKDLPSAISATQTSLTSAQSSALLIDDTLSALTSIPFSPLGSYKPDVPLHTALAQVSASLDSLTPALTTITSSLGDGKANLAILEGKLNEISTTTKGISDTLASAQTVIDQYKTVTLKLKVGVEAAQQAAPGWITTTTWILTIVLVWLLIAQLALSVQGLELLRGRRAGYDSNKILYENLNT
jgi:hypothetical protein